MSESWIALTITPKRNVKNNEMVDLTKVKVVNYRWAEKLKVFNWATLLSDHILAHQISLGDHYINVDMEDWKPLSFFSGPEDVAGLNGTYTNNRKKELGLPYNEIKRPNRQEGKCDVFKHAYG